ncbi:MAG TPA: hypothetical protein VKP64_05440 [Mycobacteriales bacterium]|nr:hypothetical protein [Mycobacteriales bacterium]
MSSTSVSEGRRGLGEYRKPLYVVAGMGDLVVEKARELPEQLTSERRRISERVATLQTEAKQLPARVMELQRELPSRLVDFQAEYKELPERVRTAAASLNEKAMEVYDELAMRGEKLVDAIRRQPSTEAAKSEARAAVRGAKAAGAAAKRAARATEKAAEDAAEQIG